MAGRKNSNSNSATVGYEAELWKMADALRGSMDAAEFRQATSRFRALVLGLVERAAVNSGRCTRMQGLTPAS